MVPMPAFDVMVPMPAFDVMVPMPAFDVMVSMPALSAEDCGSYPPLCQTKDYNYKIDICCFSAKHTAAQRKC